MLPIISFNGNYNSLYMYIFTSPKIFGFLLFFLFLFLAIAMANLSQ